MGLLRHLHKAPLRVLRLQRRKSMIRIRFSMVRLKAVLAQEKAETRQMLRIYQQYVTGQVSKAELQRANSQLADVLRATGLGVFAILPFAPITIPLIVKLGRKLGIEVMPSAFAPSSISASSVRDVLRFVVAVNINYSTFIPHKYTEILANVNRPSCSIHFPPAPSADLSIAG